jgi:hypothetical protein
MSVDLASFFVILFCVACILIESHREYEYETVVASLVAELGTAKETLAAMGRQKEELIPSDGIDSIAVDISK